MNSIREDVEVTRRMIDLIIHEEDFSSDEFDEETLKLLSELDLIDQRRSYEGKIS